MYLDTPKYSGHRLDASHYLYKWDNIPKEMPKRLDVAYFLNDYNRKRI